MGHYYSNLIHFLSSRSFLKYVEVFGYLARSARVGICLIVLASQSTVAKQENLITQEHFIEVTSIAPALDNKTVKLYLREVTSSKLQKNGTNAVLFIHGSGWPAEVDFDTPYKNYSWMKFLATAGFDTYAVDLTGYGRSTRPTEMNNPCNLSEEQQQQLIPTIIPQSCAAVHAQTLTTPESDLHDIDEAVDFILQNKQIKSLSIIGWSLAGFRSLSYSLAHPEKVKRLILLAPTYVRNVPSKNPLATISFSRLMRAENYHDYIQDWDANIKCNHQFDAAVRDVVWSELMKADSVGATWGKGVNRSPIQAWNWGLNQTTAATFTTPTLIITGEFDQLLPNDNELYNDLTIAKKRFITLACSSHNAIWEKNHLLLFQASKEWLQKTEDSDLPSGKVTAGF